eukprot:TRINITY_DN29339_c0_g1_i1.p1 TRINITY_DN29339_c0_g1~~TRINITY_DN29339_c0_g1_i1.p1  ORF type:complete len:563 (-),score=92.56 TRINITY_DN29339_c0_g1_i1:12-1700(-)
MVVGALPTAEKLPGSVTSQLVAALKQGLPDKAFCLDKDRSCQGQTPSVQDALKDMRNRLGAAAPVKQSVVWEPVECTFEDRHHAKAAMPGQLGRVEQCDEAAGQTSSAVPEERRAQFLHLLSQTLEQPPPACLSRPSTAGQSRMPEASTQQAPTRGMTSTAAEGNVQSTILSPRDAGSDASFFEGVRALQERIQQRKASWRANAASPSSRPATPSRPVTPNSRPSTPPRHENVEEMPGREATCKPPSMPAAKLTLQASCETTEHPSGSSAVKGSQPASSSSDQLLKWASDILRQASSRPPDEKAVSEEVLPGPDAASPPGHTITSSLDSPAAVTRQKRAENLRQSLQQLTEAQQQECERLASEGIQRQKASAEQQKDLDDWRERLLAAAEDLRAHLNRGCFEKAGRPVPPLGAGVSPPKPPPGPPPGAASGRRPPFFNRVGMPVTQSSRVAVGNEAEVEAARWATLEERLEAGREIRFHDIPWPGITSSVIGALADGSETASALRQKLVTALRRWHPDKWAHILERVPACEQARVMENVKCVAQRLLEEKAKLVDFPRATRR